MQNIKGVALAALTGLAVAYTAYLLGGQFAAGALAQLSAVCATKL